MKKSDKAKSNLHLKNNLTITLVISIFLVVFLFLFTLPAKRNTPLPVAEAISLEEKFDDDFVAFYEGEIAGEPVITAFDKNKFNTLQEKYDLSEKRLKMLLVLYDFGHRMNNPRNLDQLTEMSDKQLFLYGKALVDAFGETLEDDKKENLKAQFFALLKKK